jgi:DNA polymerase (family 10)
MAGVALETGFMPPSNHEIADVLGVIADLLEILDGSRFRIQEYREAASSIERLAVPASAYRDRSMLGADAGLRPDLLKQDGRLLGGDSISKYMRQLTSRAPADERVLLRPASLRPPIGRRFAALDIRDVADLIAAAEEGRLATIVGLSAGTVRRIRDAGRQLRQMPVRSLLRDARQHAAEAIEAIMLRTPHVRLVAVGGIRRAEPLIEDIELLAIGADIDALCAALAGSPLSTRIIGSTAGRVDVQLCNRQRAAVFVTPADAFGGASHLRIGSHAYGQQLIQHAARCGYRLHDDGRLERDGILVPCPDEATFDACLGLPPIADELREDAGIIDQVLAGPMPPLVSDAAMRADLHLHTTWSDGRNSIAAMAAAARARGDQLMAVTDHSASATYAGSNGLDAARLRQQAAEIATLNEHYAAAGNPFRILHGVEVDILADGSLALDDATLAQLDIVVASPHSDLDQPADDATARLLRAIRHPHVDIIGHPTGRLLGGRRGLEPDIDVLAAAAAHHDTLLEINSGPDRLDLDARLVRRAAQHGARFAVDSDAHDVASLSLRCLGVATARRAGVPADAVANTWDAAQLRAWLAARGR